MFKPTYLYIKTHNITNLKYFGKTVRDPFNYKGSGSKWLNHLRKHGNDVTTTIFGFYENESECIEAATRFSIDNNIVESTEWANQIQETGIDSTIYMLTEESVNKRTDTLRQKYGNDYFAKIAATPKTLEHKQKIREQVLNSATLGQSGKKNLGKIREKIQCPHCGKQGSANTMYRWHFDNCKKFKG